MATESLSISIDSRFRDSPDTTTDSEFVMTLPEPYRNVTRIEVVSAEIPIYSYAFSTDQTTVLQVRRGPNASGLWSHYLWDTVILSTGNYTLSGLIRELQERIGTSLGFAQAATNPEDQGFVISGDPETGRIQMGINFSSAEWGTTTGSGGNDISSYDIQFTPIDLNAAYAYGGAQGEIIPGTSSAYLDEIRVYAAAIRSWSTSLPRGTTTLRDLLGFADFILYGLPKYTTTDHFGLYGYPYVLLQINDYDAIDHITGGSIIKSLAKLSLDERGNDNGREFGGGYAFNHSSDAVSYPKVFDQPENISRIDVRLLSPTGEIVDLLGSHLSFTLRIQHIRDSRRYDAARDEYVPAGPITGYRSPPVVSRQDSRSKKQHNRLRNVRFTK